MTYEADAVTRELVTAQRIRIAELEQQLADVRAALDRACGTVREVLQGCGASAEEQLRAAGALAEPAEQLQAALSVPRPPPSFSSFYERAYHPRLQLVPTDSNPKE